VAKPRADTLLCGCQEGTTTSNNIRAYFNLYNGGYSDYQPIIRISTWDDWLNYGDYFADQVYTGASMSSAVYYPELSRCTGILMAHDGC